MNSKECKNNAKRDRAADVGQAGRRGWRLPGPILYWVIGAALSTLLLGLTALPHHSTTQARLANGNTKAVAQGVAAAKPQTDAGNGGFNIFIVLGPESPRWHDAAWANDLESRLKQELARGGFPNIGVSVGRDGSVYLAGTLFRPSEKGTVEQIVESTRGVASVHFHPGPQQLYGRGYLGLEAGPSPYHYGVRVDKVWSGSPAAMAGIRVGDIILRFGGRKVNNPEDFHFAVESYIGGQRVPVIVERDHVERHVTVRLGETSPVVMD